MSRMSIAVRFSLAMHRDDLRARLNRDVRFAAELLDKIVRHAFFQVVAADNEGHLAGVIGKVQRRLAS